MSVMADIWMDEMQATQNEMKTEGVDALKGER